MKNLFLLLLIVAALYLKGQSFIAFTDPSNKWKVLWHLEGIPFPEERTYFFNGDSTLIDSQYFQQMSYIVGNNSSIQKSDFYFRQEGQKIYKSWGTNNEPYLLYDFNLKVDDVLYPFGKPNTFYQKITKVDSLLLDNGMYARLLSVDCNLDSNPAEWLEGIGDAIHPFTSEPQCSLFDPNQLETLMCFATRGEIVYKNPDYPDCNIDGQLQHYSFTDTLNRWLIVRYFEPFYEKRIYFLKENNSIPGYKQFNYYLEDNKNEVFETNLFVKQEGSKVLLNDDPDKVLVDFSVKEGDVFKTSPNASFFQSIKKIGTIKLLDGSMVKSIEASCNDSEFENEQRIWIDGIGNNRFPINDSRFCTQDASGEDEYFLCFSRNGKVLYANEKYPDCNFSKTVKYVSEDNQWIHYYYDGPNTYSTKSKFVMTDSIVVEGKIFYALKATNVQLGSDFSTLIGYYREDNNKVYELFNGQEKVKYDFNLVVGDTFISDNRNGSPVKYRVKDIIYRSFYSNQSFSSKILTMQCDNDPQYTFKWIQGIGEEESGNQCTIDGIYGFLSCFTHNGITVYKTSPLSDCWKVGTYDQNVRSFTIYPNPVNDNLVIDSESPIETSQIFSMDGKVVASYYLDQSIDVARLSPSMYIIKVMFKNGFIGVQKFMKK